MVSKLAIAASWSAKVLRAGVLAAALVAGLAVSGTVANAAPITFFFQYDDTFDIGPAGDLLGNIIATGTMSFSDPGDGDFLLSAIGPYNFSATISGETWTELDFTAGTSTGIHITTVGSNRRLQFVGPSTGILGGSVEFVNADLFPLGFEPDGAGGAYNLFIARPATLGNYLALALAPVPEPGVSAMLVGAGITGALAFMRRRSNR